MEQRYLWKFYWDCYRNGDVEGLFVATETKIKQAIGREVYFGEILGKHSEICGTLDECDIEKIDLDSETVERVTKVLGETWSGYNPLLYLCEEEEDDCDEDYDDEDEDEDEEEDY